MAGGKKPTTNKQGGSKDSKKSKKDKGDSGPRKA
ncbi:MAG: MarR family transcriptional regulator, partial [Nitrosopumilus sp.]|nr:MarR family transcriptional regulator [Nitrosopumilus sp.]